MSILKLFSLVAEQRLVASSRALINIVLPTFTEGDNLTIAFQALGVIPGKPSEILPVASYTLKIGIFSAAGVQLAYQNAWTADPSADTYNGILNLNDAALTAALAGKTVGQTIDAYLSIQYVDTLGNVSTALPASSGQSSVKIAKAAITPGAVTVAPGEVGASVSYVTNSCVLNDPGQHRPRIEYSPNGTRYLCYVDDNGNFHSEPL